MGGWTSFARDLTEQMPLILAGLVNTLQLAGLISISGLLLGIVVFYLTLSKSAYVRNAINAYISFFIGMPLIVLLFLMYYGLPQWGIRLSPFTVAFIGFTFNGIIRCQAHSCINATPRPAPTLSQMSATKYERQTARTDGADRLHRA
jgi:His/Glu/Gln/Arg/opine family amino acid ABC transporter permease subunit